MTRKRFVKLLMSKGWKRNEAETLARGASAKRSYEELYRIAVPRIKNVVETAKKVMHAAAEAAVKLGEAARTAARAVGEMWGAVLRAMEEMDENAD